MLNYSIIDVLANFIKFIAVVAETVNSDIIFIINVLQQFEFLIELIIISIILKLIFFIQNQ